MSQKIYINSLSESKSTDIFDIEKFNRLKVGHQYYDTLEDGTRLRQVTSGEEFVEYEPPPFPSLLQIFRRFHPNGNLKLKGLHYPNKVDLGIWREYDEKGNLIKEEDYDEGYDYSFEEVINFMRLRGIDIRDKETRISRGNGIWSIKYIPDGFPLYLHTIILDGKTGNKLEQHKNKYEIIE